MDIWHGLSEVPTDLDGSVVTIGVFDGVHRGHQQLIDTAVQRAQELQVPSVLLTFDPHPAAVIRPEAMPPLLSTMVGRAALVAQRGIDSLLALKFTRDLAALEPEEFFTDILMGTLRAKTVIVGENFRFGHRASGNTDTLRELGQRHGVEVIVQDLLKVGAERCSSTRVRALLSDGDVSGAATILGRPFSVFEIVARGAGRGGAELGYPTANMYVSDKYAVPADGVYAGWFIVRSYSPIVGDMERDVRYPAAISVGTNPTFGDTRRSVETFVLDRHADLYGHACEVEFVDFVRGMEKFSSVEELLVAMERDVARVREILAQ
ncbi:bifunctional riboflavin kinase/FAD synthetase [Staphylococcus chromogenes]|nr:bifunctional riboflavin kinase/FAD synthetase [Staphylococcus chromogenes]